jgi:hypothetical protein
MEKNNFELNLEDANKLIKYLKSNVNISNVLSKISPKLKLSYDNRSIPYDKDGHLKHDLSK